MGVWLADTIHSRRASRTGKILVLGLSFKPDVPDLRNSKVVDVVRRLEWLGHEVVVHDPLAAPEAARHEYGLSLERDIPGGRYDVILAAVPHRPYRSLGSSDLATLARDEALLVDLHGIWRGQDLPVGMDYWVP